MLHIGKKIREVLEERGISVVIFSKKIKRSRNVAYDIFERESIDTELLKKIGEVLSFDFFAMYKNKKTYPENNIINEVSEDVVTFDSKLKNEIKLLKQENASLQKEINYLKKILNLLEKKK